MTTFKQAPIYAEVLLSMLDAVFSKELDFGESIGIAGVLNSVGWQFKGGDSAAIFSSTEVENSGTYFVNCTSYELANEFMRRDRISKGEYTVHAGTAAWSRDADSLIDILRNRALTRTIRNSALNRARANYAVCAYFDGYMREVGSMSTGLFGTYKVMSDIMRTVSVSTEYSQSLDADGTIRQFIKEYVIGGSVSSFVSIVHVNKIVDSAINLMTETSLLSILTARSAIGKLIGKATDRVYRDRVEAVIDEEDPVNAAGYARVSEIIFGSSIYNGEYVADIPTKVTANAVVFGRCERAVILGISDLKRMQSMLTTNASLIVATCAQACTGSAKTVEQGAGLVSIMNRHFEIMATMMNRVTMGSEVKLCKALKKTFAAYMAILAGPLCAEEAAVLKADAISEFPSSADLLEEWIEGCLAFAPHLAFNVGKLYKMLPAPDSTPGGTYIDRIKQVVVPNAVDPAIIALLEVELRDHIVMGLIRKPGVKKFPRKAGVAKPIWWHSYLSGDFNMVPTTGLSNILAWENSQVMSARSPLSPSNWKDSGLAPDTVEGVFDHTTPKYLKNMLLRMVFDPDCPMPGAEDAALIEEWLSKCDSKPESAKDPYRTIFIAALRVRFFKSRLEAAVGDVCAKHPAFMIGASSTDKLNRIMAFVDPNTPGIILYYSFDVAGWSPFMPMDVQHMSHRVWNDVFTCDRFLDSHKATDGAPICLNSNGWQAWYKGTGANLEGYDGKEMTMLNVAMMSLSVKRWRADPRTLDIFTADEVNVISALLMSYIDDGTSRQDIGMARAKVAPAFDIFKKVCVETFLGCGFKIEPSKCFPSDRFFIFLNEPYYAGRHLAHGVRAAGQICSVQAEEHESLPEIAMKVATSVRGAKMAGLDPTPCLVLAAFHMQMLLKVWVKERDPALLSLWCYTPRAWGGLGMPSMLQISTSTSGEAFVEGVSLLQKWARIHAPARRLYLNMCRTEMRQNTSVGVLSTPLSVKPITGYMPSTRVGEAVREKMGIIRDRGELGTLPTQYLAFGNEDNYKIYASTVVTLEPGKVYQASMLRDLGDAHPHVVFKQFTGRIEKGATVRGILAKSVVDSIVKGHKDDADNAIRIFKANVTRRN